LEQELDRVRRRNEEIEITMHRELKNQSSVFEQRINQLTDENELLRKNFREASDVNRKLPEYENKIALLSKEI
jgi:hypothetical protein